MSEARREYESYLEDAKSAMAYSGLTSEGIEALLENLIMAAYEDRGWL